MIKNKNVKLLSYGVSFNENLETFGHTIYIYKNLYTINLYIKITIKFNYKNN